MQRVLIGDLKEYIGAEASIAGWVSVRRDQGKMVFFDLRDETGYVQGVVLPKSEAMEPAKDVRSEYVISITGKVNKRPEKNVNTDAPNGDIELEILSLDILSAAETPPFDPTEDTSEIDETVRLSHRYIDLRSRRMQRNIRVRSDWVQKCREYLLEHSFVEIETPLLTESTPEGSRDFVVPSRHNPGKFYALPQSPQQYKQLLMAGGFERYFQVARAVRDEDLRADRGYEHTQIDIEMSFADQETVLTLVEGMFVYAAEALGRTIKEKPFPRIPYQEAMERYGDDKFDLRTDEEKKRGTLAYAWVVDFPFFKKTDDGGWTFTHNPFSAPKDEYRDDLRAGKNIENITAQQYDLVCNGYETAGGSIRTNSSDTLRATYKVMGYTDKETEERIGHMLEAFRYGTPPHGGIAVGVERNIMNLTGEQYLREVQAFPMTRRGQTAVMKAPKELTQEQLDELGLKIQKRKTDE